MSNFVDLTGQKFNRLTVRNYFGKSKSGRSLWLCDCECGGTNVVRTADLRNGHTKSCGCLFIETSIAKLPEDVKGDKNPNYRHGQAHTRLYHVWCDIKGRCLNENRENYERYGGKGVTMCNEWKDNFDAFRKWAMDNGFCEESTGKEQSIDRIDPRKGYCPENCQWITLSENVTRRNLDYWSRVHANQR
jgi:hypothetical protein